MPRINLLTLARTTTQNSAREFGLAAGGRVAPRILFALGGKLLYSSWIDSQNGEERSAEDGDRQARRADRRHHGSRGSQAAARRAHGDHREAAAQPAGDRASVRRTGADGSRRRLPHVDQADRQQARNSRHRAVEHARVDVHAQHRRLGWMDNPVLQVVESAKDSPTGGSSFVLFTDTVGVDLENGGTIPTGERVAAK